MAKTYATGKPCKNGHISPRYVINRQCLECSRQISKARRQERAAYNRQYHAKHSKRIMARQVVYQRTRRGLPAATRESPEFCELCSGLSAPGLALDHDHTTGKFRGWLCVNCNTGIGKLGDNIAGLERAIAYLKRAE